MKKRKIVAAAVMTIAMKVIQIDYVEEEEEEVKVNVYINQNKYVCII
jgi:hypothetical protein